MDVEGAQTIFALGWAGGICNEVLHWWNIRRDANLPDYARKIRYWVVTGLMILLGGFIAYLVLRRCLYKARASPDWADHTHAVATPRARGSKTQGRPRRRREHGQFSEPVASHRMRVASLVVGINHYADLYYRSGDRILKYAEADAAAFHEYVRSAWPSSDGVDQLILPGTDANAANIAAALAGLARRGPFDLFIVYLAGHGDKREDEAG